MSGVVVVAGVFPPGSVVTLIQVPDETVLRPEGHDTVGTRLVDEFGNVGFDGLTIGDRFFARGYVNGNYTLVRCRAVDADAPDSELIQPPIGPSPQNVGTQEARVVDPAPEAPAGLETGVPEAAAGALSIVGQEPVKAQALYLHVGQDAIDPSGWVESGYQTVATVAADGSTIASEPLYRPLEDVSAVGPDWQHYEGPSELVPAAQQLPPEPPAQAQQGASESAQQGGGGAPPAEAQPPAPDVQGQQTVPSESAGVQEGAGSPSEQKPLYTYSGPEGQVDLSVWSKAPLATVDGQPLYTYAADAAGGAASGDGLGGVWHVYTGATTGPSAPAAAASAASGKDPATPVA